MPIRVHHILLQYNHIVLRYVCIVNQYTVVMINTSAKPSRAHVLAAQIMVILLIVGALATQFHLLPALAAQQAAEDPANAYLQWPYTLWCGLIIAVFLVALCSIWNLLMLVKHDTVFTPSSRRWVTLIIYCAIIDTALLALLLAHITLIAHVGTAFTNSILAAMVIFGIAFVLIMLVMRQLLDNATADRSELEAVI